jgi:hypothetical protein
MYSAGWLILRLQVGNYNRISALAGELDHISLFNFMASLGFSLEFDLPGTP